MKASKKLKLAMNGNKNANRIANETKAERLARIEFAKSHPVSAGVIPMVDYVAPSGSYAPSARASEPTGNQARFVVKAIRAIQANMEANKV
jgi:hypothetical protein